VSKRPQDRRKKLPTGPAGKPGVPVAFVGVLAVVIMPAVGLWLWTTTRTTESLGTPQPIGANAAASPSAAVASKADLQRLKGRWVRPDGGYLLEIRAVDGSGKLDASYSNPRPINVSAARASRDGETIKVFIELRDVNYPGSTYDLTYDPQSDSLNGIYYQAALQQRFEVVFSRRN
jgi:hypothetical protein